MSFTDALRNNMEIEPYETREQFMLRYTGMRPVGENTTLAHWVQKVALASSLGNPKLEQDLIWGGTVYQLHHSLHLAMDFATSKTAPEIRAEGVQTALEAALFGHSENLRAVRMNAPQHAAGIVDIDPSALAPHIVADMQKANALYDALQAQQRTNQR